MSGYEESERAVGDDGLVLCGDWLRRGARRLCGACANGWRGGEDEPSGCGTLLERLPED